MHQCLWVCQTRRMQKSVSGKFCHFLFITSCSLTGTWVLEAKYTSHSCNKRQCSLPVRWPYYHIWLKVRSECHRTMVRNSKEMKEVKEIWAPYLVRKALLCWSYWPSTKRHMVYCCIYYQSLLISADGLCDFSDSSLVGLLTVTVDRVNEVLSEMVALITPRSHWRGSINGWPVA